MTHSPGPWWFTATEEEGYYVAGAGDKELTNLISREDARLIAAAPETAAERDRLRTLNDGLVVALDQTRQKSKMVQAINSELVDAIEGVLHHQIYGTSTRYRAALQHCRAVLARARGTA